MSWTAETPLANLAAARAALAAQGHGPNNFIVPVYSGGAMPAMAVLRHYPNDPVFRAHCAAIPGVTVRDYGQLVIGMDATAAAIGGRWGGNAPLLQGQVTPGLYRAIPADGGLLWNVIQPFDRTVFNLVLTTYPALCQRARTPGEIAPWVQPTAENPFKLLEPFTQQPDRVIHLGQRWRVSQADGAGNNTWEPGAFGWISEGAAA